MSTLYTPSDGGERLDNALIRRDVLQLDSMLQGQALRVCMCCPTSSSFTTMLLSFCLFPSCACPWVWTGAKFVDDNNAQRLHWLPFGWKEYPHE
jgi:hypothetical protein